MHDHNINSSDLTTSTDNILYPSSESPDYTYTFKESWIKELGWKGVILFSILEGLTCSQGYVYASDKYLAKKCEVSVTTIEKGLKALEDKGWIFRNSYPVNLGSKRHIVIQHKYLTYWKSYLSKPSIPKDVKSRFLKLFPHEPFSETRAVKSDGSSRAVKSDGSFPKGKELLSKSSKADGENAAAFFLLLRKGFDEANLSSKELSLATDYVKDYPEVIATRGNPVGWLVSGFKDGWIYDRINRPKPEEKQQHLYDDNKAKAKEIKNLYFTDAKQKGIVIEALNKQLEFVITGGQCSAVVIEYTDSLFDQKVETHLKKFKLIGKRNDSIQHSRKTNPVEESGKAKEQVLRSAATEKERDQNSCAISDENKETDFNAP